MYCSREEPAKEEQQEKGLLENGAWLFVWILGFVVVLQLLTVFSSALKPLVLAGLFVWVLESIVQLLEFIQWKLFQIVYLLVTKAMLALYIVGIKMVQWCMFVTAPYCCHSYDSSRYDVTQRRRDLCNWERVFLPWQGLYAGKNAYLRFVAVVVTLLLLTFLVMAFAAMVVDDIMSLRAKLVEYERQVVTIFELSIEQLHRLPDEWTFLSNSTRRELNETIISFTSNFEGQAYAQEVSSTIQEFISTVAASGGAFATETTFFVLYSILWLFDPFHMHRSVAEETEADDKFRIFTPLRTAVVLPPDQERAFGPRISFASRGTKGSRVGLDPLSMARTLTRRLTVTGTGRGTGRGTVVLAPLAVNENDGRLSQRSRSSASGSMNMQDQLYIIMWQSFYVRVLLHAIFGAIIALLFSALKIEFGLLIGITSFFLLFIPQLGVIIASILPIPVILLAPSDSLAGAEDSSEGGYHWTLRKHLLLMSMGSMVLLRWLVLVQVERCILNRLVAGKPELARHVSALEVHPAVVLFFVVFAHNVWGTAGMMMTLPLIIIVRISMGSAEQDDGPDKDD